MSKRQLESVFPETSKRVKESAAEKLRCIFPVPKWLIENDGMGRVAFMTYGRYQPAHIGHKSVFDKLVEMSRVDKTESGFENASWESSGGEVASNVFVFASPTVDKARPPVSTTRKRVTAVKPGRYPLSPDLKTQLMEEQTALYENPRINIINMASPKNQADGRRDPWAAVRLLLACYNHVFMLVGSDRVKDFAWIAQDPRVTVMSAGERDEKALGAMGMSGTKLREAVQRGDDETAMAGMRYGAVTDNTLARVIQALRSAMQKGGRKWRMRKTRASSRKNRRRQTRRKRRSYMKN